MRPLDPTFIDRVRETSLGVGVLVGTVILLMAGWLPALNFAFGLGAALLLWHVAAVVADEVIRREAWRARDVVRLLLLYLGKYVLIAGVLGVMYKFGRLDTLAFTAGFALPTGVVTLKALGLSMLSDDDEAAPIYSRHRKASRLD